MIISNDELMRDLHDFLGAGLGDDGRRRRSP